MRRVSRNKTAESANKRLEQRFIDSKTINEGSGDESLEESQDGSDLTRDILVDFEIRELAYKIIEKYPKITLSTIPVLFRNLGGLLDLDLNPNKRPNNIGG